MPNISFASGGMYCYYISLLANLFYFYFIFFVSIVLYNNYKKLGDPYLQDYVAFVAKSKTLNRACYVMECKGGIAQDVIMTIGQAFELR